MDHSNIKQIFHQKKKIKMWVGYILPPFFALPGLRKDVGKGRTKRTGTVGMRKVVGREILCI